MDTEISTKTLRANRRKKGALIAAGVSALVVALLLLRSGIRPTLDLSTVTTSVVERGTIENTLNASGEVLPEFEQVISSPINATIKAVILDAGATVKAGDVILSLDKSATEMEYQRARFQLESKRNSITKLKLDLGKTAYDIRSSNDIKELNISSLQSAVEDARRLYKAGGGTRESVEQAELALKVANLEKRRLEHEIRNKELTMGVDIREAQIAAAIEENALNELGKKLQQATIAAESAGVVTWVNKNIGTTITQGEPLARIADLRSFKVKANITDTYLDDVKPAMPVIIKINDSTVRGSVAGINPSVQNGILSFDIAIPPGNTLLLRPNMKVEVFLITSTRNNVLRVQNGPAFSGGVTQDVFVLERGKAIRKKVTTGGSNFDHIELKNGVKAGDVIIISDTKAFQGMDEVEVKNSKSGN